MKQLFVYIILILVLVVRILTHLNSLPKYTDGQKLEFKIFIAEEPRAYSTTESVNISGIRVYFPKYLNVDYGDYLVFSGVVKDNSIYEPEIIAHKKHILLFSSSRGRVLEFINRNLPSQHAALVSGIVLGSKEGISKPFWDELISSGLAHIVVASGANVAMVATFIFSIFLVVFGRKRAIVFSMISLWAYVLFAGLDTPLIRAAVMASVILVGKYFGRVVVAVRIAAFTVFLMLLVNPAWIHDFGFLLSVVATFSLILFTAQVYKLIHFVPGVIREDLTTSLAAQIGVAPLIFIFFHEVNLLSPLINTLVAWTIAPIMAIGFVSAIIGLVFPQIAGYLLILVYPLTSFFIFVVNAL